MNIGIRKEVLRELRITFKNLSEEEKKIYKNTKINKRNRRRWKERIIHETTRKGNYLLSK